jgi:hypothetical protein
VIPALWIIERDGHCNVSEKEKRKALEAIIQWSDGFQIDEQKDATIVPIPQPSSLIWNEEGAVGKVTEVNTLYGEFYTDFQAEDLWKLNIRIGNTFRFTLNGGNFEGIYDYYPFIRAIQREDIKYLLSEDAEGRTCISKNCLHTATVSFGATDIRIDSNISILSNKPPLMAQPRKR